MKRFLQLSLIALLLGLTLSACGSGTVTPTYPGGTSIQAPTSFSDSVKNGTRETPKNATVAAFKTTDDLAKVKASFIDSFKTGQWTDQSSTIGNQDGLQQFQTSGGFLLAYQKGTTALAVIGLPNALASTAGFTGLAATENVYVVFSGDTP